MLNPVKGSPGCFKDTIVIPEYYVEVEPRRFVHEFRLGDFREEDKYDTVRIYPSKRKITRWQAHRIWWTMRIGWWLVETGEAIERVGMRLRGYRLEDF